MASEGGTVVMLIAAMPWGAGFGMFTDKGGIRWMVSIENGVPTHM